jgi:site-specific DNA-cytosine methylase
MGFPPCIEFSKASMPSSWVCNQNRPPKPDTELLEHTIRIIRAVNPKFWVIENVAGGRKYFWGYLGNYTKKIGSRYLWGKFPDFKVNSELCYGKYNIYPRADRAAIRSRIPYPISEALAIAIEKAVT